MPTRRDFTFTSAAGRRLRAFYAEPELDGEPTAAMPAVIVVHEIMGLNDDIRDIAARFADNGYVALAPDLVGYGFPPFASPASSTAWVAWGTDAPTARCARSRTG